MKTFKHILPFLLALLVLAGCEDDVNYTQGTAENPDCYGVYFPKKQATRTDLEFEPGTRPKRPIRSNGATPWIRSSFRSS